MKQTPNWLVERKVILEGQTIIYSYDKEGDILEIIFRDGGGVGIDLTENIVLRFDQSSGEALSLMLISFSKLIEPTKFGPSSFPLTALDDLPPAMQQSVLKILHAYPVNRFLTVSGLFLTPGGDLQPITYLTQPDNLALELDPA
ncbi:MAG: DUF2283 domain-containing protein [Chloroflexi bacterium]|nr:DUF2283 domain-containing protein [Chloroflexota bacterium]